MKPKAVPSPIKIRPDPSLVLPKYIHGLLNENNLTGGRLKKQLIFRNFGSGLTD
jgi:hypothetical protein